MRLNWKLEFPSRVICSEESILLEEYELVGIRSNLLVSRDVSVLFSRPGGNGALLEFLFRGVDFVSFSFEKSVEPLGLNFLAFLPKGEAFLNEYFEYNNEDIEMDLIFSLSDGGHVRIGGDESQVRAQDNLQIMI